jgi:hypothetical protein
MKSLLVGRTEREIMEELRHEIRETLQAISDGLNQCVNGRLPVV